MLKIFRVRGSSMRPTLLNRDLVAVISGAIDINDLVVVGTSGGFIVKRVATMGESWLTLKSDNTHTESYFCFRQVSRSLVVGRVLASFGSQQWLKVFPGNRLAHKGAESEFEQTGA